MTDYFRIQTPFRPRKRRTVQGPLAVLAVLVLLAVCAVLWLAGCALALGTANAWIIQDTFGEGWHAVWRRWPISLLWGLLMGGFIRRGNGSSSK